jgi:hypothetical protein
LAASQNRDGAIYFTDSFSFTPEHLAAMWRCKLALVHEALTRFQRLGMIGIDDEGTIWILNWSKYQNTAGLARIRERSLMQLEDRSSAGTSRAPGVPLVSSRTRELAAARQRKHRQKEKQQGANGVVTHNALRSVTECVTPTPPTTDSQRETVTAQNKIENKKVEEPSTVSQRETRANDFSATKEWLKKLFGRQRAWSYKEDQLLAGLLPISRNERALLSWAYTLPRDSEGWVLIDGERASKPKQSLITLLREFSSEIDKWRSARANHNEASESPPTTPPANDEWTPERRAAIEEIEELGPGCDPGPFHLLDRDMRRRIDERASKNAA